MPPRASPVRFGLVLGLAAAILVGSAVGLVSGSGVAIAAVTAAYLGYEVLLGLALSTAAILGVRAWSRGRASAASTELPTVSVLVAAHNERACILDTLDSLRRQTGTRLDVLVASDGSNDGMNALVIEAHALHRSRADLAAWEGRLGPHRLRLLALPKLGKGGALNAALARVESEVVVTLDADTTLADGAIAALARPFADAEVGAASGFVYVRNAARAGWLARYQFTEYVKNFVWRIGLAHAGVNLQVSGAFGALRTELLRRLGGFDEDSLVEDYEVIYRLHARAHESGERARVVAVPDAAAFTDGPEDLGGFVRQRTRWFAGFLTTLWDYRGMIASGRYGRVGRVMLPIKSADAMLPLWGFASLVLLVAGLAGRGPISAVTLGLLAGKWVLDGVLYLVLLAWHARTFPERHRTLSPRIQAFCALTEGIVFNWMRQIAVLRAYGWALRRVNRWEQARWSTPVPAGASEAATGTPARTGS